jgi:hypothetical protein
MVEVLRSGERYTVSLNGDEMATFKHLLDANCFALQLVEREMAASVTLVSGLIVCA